MNWQQLLSLKRYGDSQPRPRANQDELRLGFEVDYDRVIFSQHFRSLQDKTQVIPLSQTGFVHTRLTHSLEVSVVGRSLGRMAGKLLLEKHPDLVSLGYKQQDFGAIVAAAALAHDIGNPPFGHSGEKAIGSFFKTDRGAGMISTLSRKQQQDLLSYEGNANGYRLLNLDSPGTSGGLRLSYATLGAFIKYPKESLPHRPTKHISQKKYGIFQADLAHFNDVANELGLVNRTDNEESHYRHPLTYLVEAADDICYTIIDFEDGINLGWISEDHALEQLINLVRDTIRTEVYTQLSTTSERLSYLRSLAINNLITDCVAIFMENEEAILAGTFPHALTDRSKYKSQIQDILSITIDRVYNNEEVIQKEIAGYKILQDILAAAVEASINDLNNVDNSYDQLILKSCKGLKINGTSDYERILDVCGYVASLTDSKSIALFEVINGKI
ncbi:dGTP triphosphohydrolase [Nonlabens sp.]|uniref:dGTP triphosphohydrolase n=1 Tax=Nonlabens sp. TaxID=1888209 RepID=UPI003F6A348E